LSEFNAAAVEFLVVGAFAMAVHGRVRATGDLDIWVRPSGDNAQRLMRALASFGAPLHDLTQDDLSRPGIVFQIGVAPFRIDILTSIDGVDFDAAWADRFVTQFAGQPVAVLSTRFLILNKRAAGRPQDLADVAWLEDPQSRES
jgi:hypothetical protein